MKKNSPILIVGITAAAGLLLTGAAFLTLGYGEEAIRLALRETARLSMLIFLPVFVASSLYRLTKGPMSKWLMVHRRYLGIAFGVSHIIHLALIVSLIYFYSNGNLLSIAPLSSYIVGGIGYLFIFAMLLTSNNRSIKMLGHRLWKRIHTSGMYYLFFSFFVSFIGLLEKNLALYLPIVLAMLLALLIRLSVYLPKLNKARTV